VKCAFGVVQEILSPHITIWVSAKLAYIYLVAFVVGHANQGKGYCVEIHYKSIVVVAYGIFIGP
jgi:hypothetical protein